MRVALSFAALAALSSAPAIAQAVACRAPSRIVSPRNVGPSAKDPMRRIPIGGYTLALSWTPGFCAGRSDPDSAFQCRSGARFGFVLHGLWPDGEGRAWPQYCRPAAILPQPVLRANLCTTPSAQLLQHEWAKHGTCMARDPARYFDRARGLYAGIRFPDPTAAKTAGDLVWMMAAANRGIPAGAIRVRAGQGGALQELWLCLDRRMRFARCGAQQRGGVSPATRLRVAR